MEFQEHVTRTDIALILTWWILDEAKLDQGRFKRRQEMETEGALVKAGDVHPEKILAVSHPWESMEHPDPRGDQLRKLAKILREKECRGGGRYKASFYDFSCLWQFKRLEKKMDDDFYAALEKMHLLYSTPEVATLRIEEIEPWPGLDPYPQSAPSIRTPPPRPPRSTP